MSELALGKGKGRVSEEALPTPLALLPVVYLPVFLGRRRTNSKQSVHRLSRLPSMVLARPLYSGEQEPVTGWPVKMPLEGVTAELKAKEGCGQVLS